MYTIQVYGKITMMDDCKLYKHQKFDTYSFALKKFISLNLKINKQIMKPIHECFNMFYKMSRIKRHHISDDQKIKYIIGNFKNNNIESNISICNDINNEIVYVKHFNKSNNKLIKIIMYFNKQKNNNKQKSNNKQKNKLKDFSISSILLDD